MWHSVVRKFHRSRNATSNSRSRHLVNGCTPLPPCNEYETFQYTPQYTPPQRQFEYRPRPAPHVLSGLPPWGGPPPAAPPFPTPVYTYPYQNNGAGYQKPYMNQAPNAPATRSFGLEGPSHQSGLSAGYFEVVSFPQPTFPTTPDFSR